MALAAFQMGDQLRILLPSREQREVLQFPGFSESLHPVKMTTSPYSDKGDLRAYHRHLQWKNSGADEMDWREGLVSSSAGFLEPGKRNHC